MIGVRGLRYLVRINNRKEFLESVTARTSIDKSEAFCSTAVDPITGCVNRCACCVVNVAPALWIDDTAQDELCGAMRREKNKIRKRTVAAAIYRYEVAEIGPTTQS